MALRLSTGLRNNLLGDGTGNSFKALFLNGVLEIYSGNQPSDPDAIESGTKLVRITVDGGAFTPGAATNGLEFDAATAGAISKAAAEAWQGAGLAVGTAGWYRFYTNAYTTGASTTAIRFDGNVATAGSQLDLSSTAIKVSLPITIDTFKVTLPAS